MKNTQMFYQHTPGIVEGQKRNQFSKVIKASHSFSNCWVSFTQQQKIVSFLNTFISRHLTINIANIFYVRQHEAHQVVELASNWISFNIFGTFLKLQQFPQFSTRRSNKHQGVSKPVIQISQNFNFSQLQMKTEREINTKEVCKH